MPSTDSGLILDPNSPSALFDHDWGKADPTNPETRTRLSALITQLRARAATHAAELAAKASEPKAKRAKAPTLASADDAALADKPISELTLDDLMGGPT